MLSHVQIKVKKTSVIKEYLNFLRAFAGNVCPEFEGKKYHQILVIYHEELDDYKTLTQFKVKGEFKENCFLEPKLRASLNSDSEQSEIEVFKSVTFFSKT